LLRRRPTPLFELGAAAVSRVSNHDRVERSSCPFSPEGRFVGSVKPPVVAGKRRPATTDLLISGTAVLASFPKTGINRFLLLEIRKPFLENGLARNLNVRSVTWRG